MGSHSELLVDLGRKRNDARRRDIIIGGPNVTSRTGLYPSQLAKSIVEGVKGLFDTKQRRPTALPKAPPRKIPEALNVDEVSEADPEEVDDMGFVDHPAQDEESKPELTKVKVSKEVRNAVLRIHKNLRHPSKEQLVRTFRACGASDEAIAAVEQLECPICHEMNRPAVGHARFRRG